MAYLIDTAVLLRLANTSDSQNALAEAAILELRNRSEELKIAAQNLIEFRSVGTRPTADNGLGYTPAVVEAQSAKFEALFTLLDESRDIYPAWKSIVHAAKVIGNQVHDARIVAFCHVHKISHILTFDTKHFARLATIGPGVTIVDPKNV